MRLTVASVGSIFGKRLPAPRGRSACPFRKHKQTRPTFWVFKGKGDDELWKCFACDEPNAGDPIELYRRLGDCADRKTAWVQLKDRGYEVPGLDEDRRPASRAPVRPVVREEKPKIPFRGTPPKSILTLDQASWAKWSALRIGTVERFAKLRALDPEAMRRHDVVDMPGGRHIGFTYRDPRTGMPCRVKVRGVSEKTFFVEPMGKAADEARSLGPLYLAHLLRPLGTSVIEPVILVEGEVDALTLVVLGFANVVSLPNGANSAKQIDLSPLYPAFNVWLVATDADHGGDAAFAVLRDRARGLGVDVARVRWSMHVGDEPVLYKDSNEALMKGRTREDFVACLDAVMQARFGQTVQWARAA